METVMSSASRAESRKLLDAVDGERLLATAVKLIAVPSPTGDGGACADTLARVLEADGFNVERPTANHPAAPAVVVRLDTGKPGCCLQFNGHLDTVHLPFVPPQVEGDRLTGRGASDMKAGIAASVEALRALRDADALPAGSVLLTAHDLHECPWGDNRQLSALIATGHVGDGVLLPEYHNSNLPVIGRGGLIWKATFRRPGLPIHETLRPDEPSVLAALARAVDELGRLDRQVGQRRDHFAGAESVFVGQVHGGTIFNQYPQECWLEGTRRWLPGTDRAAVEQELRDLFDNVARHAGAGVEVRFSLMRDAFRLDENNPLAADFQRAHAELCGRPLPLGGKPFCDDGNTFWAEADVPSITHGPAAGGAHTLDEWVSIADLARVARLYALTAVAFCAGL
jgi:acetylornithine deacetylase/succinyl-diaminopimelate desuccinylase-like protein